jgi:aryl-alcohol dehydrogenase-like predicted oxidoreductase
VIWLHYRNLGKSGLKVSEICLGTWHLKPLIDERDTRGIVKVDEKGSLEIMERAFDLGVNFIDTSDRYHGTSHLSPLAYVGFAEKLVGKFLQGRREDVVLCTKVRGKMGEGPNDEGLSRVHVMQGFKHSLERLKTDYVDLYLAHWPDASTPMEETLRAFDDLVRWGKVYYIGVSNFSVWQIMSALQISERENLEKFVACQNLYNMLERQAEIELLPFARAYGLGVFSYSSLAQGLLTGKYRAGAEPPKGSRATYVKKGEWSKYFTKRKFKIVEQLREIAEEKNVSLAQLSIAWLLARPGISSVSISATSTEQIDENVGALDVKITPDDEKRINEVLSPIVASEKYPLL